MLRPVLAFLTLLFAFAAWLDAPRLWPAEPAPPRLPDLVLAPLPPTVETPVCEPASVRASIDSVETSVFPGEREPLSIAGTRDWVLVIDTSGSMRAQGRLDHARRAARALHASLEPGDGFALVAFADEPRLVLDWPDRADTHTVERALASLTEAGETDLHGGVRLAANLLRQRPAPTRPGRLVLLSDGRANRGEISIDALADLAGELRALNTDVQAIGLGRDHDPEALGTLARISDGRYHPVHRPSELVEVFLAAGPGRASSPDRPTGARGPR